MKSFVFLTEKFDSLGDFVKLKSRLVAMGNETVDMEVSSPTVSRASVYAVTAIAAVEGRHVLSGDIGSAFLNAYIPAGVKILVPLDEVNSELLCQLRPEYRIYLNKHAEKTVKLDRTLAAYRAQGYGIKLSVISSHQLNLLMMETDVCLTIRR